MRRFLFFVFAFSMVMSEAVAQIYNPAVVNATLSRQIPIDLSQGYHLDLICEIGNLGNTPMSDLRNSQKMKMIISLLGVDLLDPIHPENSLILPSFLEFTAYDSIQKIVLLTQKASIPAQTVQMMSVHTRLTSLSISETQTSINGFMINIIPPGYTNVGNITVDDFTAIYGYTTVPSQLPVELVSFKGQVEDCKVHLKWKTASELNNEFFLVRKSPDGVKWTEIGRVEGNGTISIPQDYFFEDQEVLGSGFYYQLVQNDFDGKKEFSPLIFMDGELCEDSKFLIYPNPAQNIVNIDLVNQQQFQYAGEIYSVNGQLVKTFHLDTPKTILSVDDIIPGSYIFKVENGTQVITQKIVIQR